MKSKKLIELLQAEDPTGETEVCVDNCDILYVDRLPAFYDGKLQTITYDKDGYPIGGKYHTKGDKIMIDTLSISGLIERCLYSQEEYEIDYSELSGATLKRYKEANEETRKNYLTILESLELKLFNEWFIQKIEDDYPALKHTTEEFFRKNLSRAIPIPEDIREPVVLPDGTKQYKSYAEWRKIQWDRELSVRFDGLDWVIKRVSGISMTPEVQELKEYKYNVSPPGPKESLYSRIVKFFFS